jgi:hypothetical protein
MPNNSREGNQTGFFKIYLSGESEAELMKSEIKFIVISRLGV